MCENNVSHDYEDPNSLSMARAFGMEFNSARMMFSALLSIDSALFIGGFSSLAFNFWFMSLNFLEVYNFHFQVIKIKPIEV